MIGALGPALAEPGLPFAAAVSLLAGLVYGFAGFGSALIFIPLATLVLPPALAIAAFSLSAFASLVTVVPGAWPVAERRAVAVMLGVSILVTPLGVLVLRLAPEEVLRSIVAVLTLATLAALAAGWRVPVGAGLGARAGVGALSGLAGGATGLNGPPVILFNLGTEGQPVAVTRANLAVFLTLSSLSILPQLWAQGLLPARAIGIGAVLLVPYGIGTWAGVRLFRPERAGLYRRIAYALIGGAGLAALPVWT
ncbi:MAG: sulfite exporter TauE/SafE family protein [Roseicyclus sp.]